MPPLLWAHAAELSVPAERGTPSALACKGAVTSRVRVLTCALGPGLRLHPRPNLAEQVQCFCFDQQRLLPHETVDMPVFFYIDPEFLDDPNMAGINTLTLSYTFFRADRDAHRLPEYLQGMEPGAKLHNPVPPPPALAPAAAPA